MLLLLLTSLGASGAPATPVQAIESYADRLRALEVRPSTLTRFIEDVVDLEEVSARLLGPHRRAFSAEQQKEFSRLFVAILVARAWQRAEALGDFANTCVLDKSSVVRCELRRGKDKVRAYFTLRGTRIVDARVGDMGMVKENRGAIDRLIRARGADGLLERMRRRAAELRSNASAARR